MTEGRNRRSHERRSRATIELKEAISSKGEYVQKVVVRYRDEMSVEEFSSLLRSWNAPKKILEVVEDPETAKFVGLQVAALILTDNFEWLYQQINQRSSLLDRVLLAELANSIDDSDEEVSSKLADLALLVESTIIRLFGDEARKLETR